MKHSTFRKSTLISSIALLLVAIVALSGATFAWFTSNTTASASGLVFSANAANGLQVSLDKSSWGQEVTLTNSDTTLDAISFDLTGNSLGAAYQVLAAAENSSDAKEGATISGASDAAFYSTMIYTKLTGSNESATVKLSSIDIKAVDGQALAGCVRVAVEYNGTLLGVYSTVDATMNYLAGTGTFTEGTSNAATYSVKADASVSSVTAGTITPSGNDYFEITVYLDGEDAACMTNNVNAQDIISGIELGFEVA